MLERWHGSLKTAIMAANDPSCSQVLPFVLFKVRTDDRQEFAASSAGLVYGKNLRLHGDQVLDKWDDCITIEGSSTTLSRVASRKHP